MAIFTTPQGQAVPCPGENAFDAALFLLNTFGRKGFKRLAQYCETGAYLAELTGVTQMVSIDLEFHPLVAGRIPQITAALRTYERDADHE